jgi:ribosomal protein S18 acetylase RimI-like enzyme
MSLIPPPHRPRIYLLSEEHRPALDRLLDQERWGTLYLRSLVREFGVSPTAHPEHGRFLAARHRDEFSAVLFVGNSRNLTSMGDVADLSALLERAYEEPVPPRLFVGPAEHARAVREAFAHHGALPFLDREQLYYVLTPDALAVREPIALRPARDADTECVTLAQAAMTEEDLLVSRSHIDLDRLRDISARRIVAGKVWVLMDGATLLFKAEESARTEDGLLIGGVFTDPQHRGRGLATRGIAAWARHLFGEGLSLVALHVNRDNLPAVRAYEKVGFRRHSTLRLMLSY